MDGKASKPLSSTESSPTANTSSLLSSNYQPSNRHVDQTVNRNDCAVRVNAESFSASRTSSEEYIKWLSRTSSNSHAKVTSETQSHPVTAKPNYCNQRETTSGYCGQGYGQATQARHGSYITQTRRNETVQALSGNLNRAYKPVTFVRATSESPFRISRQDTQVKSSTNVMQQPRDKTAKATYDQYTPLRKSQVTQAESSTSVMQQPRDKTAKATYDQYTPLRKSQVTQVKSSTNVMQQHRDKTARATYDQYTPLRKPQVTQAESSTSVMQQHRDKTVKASYDQYTPLRKSQVTQAESSTSVMQQHRDKTARATYDQYTPLRKSQVTQAESSTSVMQQPRDKTARATYQYTPLRKSQVTQAEASTNVMQQPRDKIARATYDQYTPLRKSQVTQPESSTNVMHVASLCKPVFTQAKSKTVVDPPNSIVTQVRPYEIHKQPKRQVQTPSKHFAFDPLSGSLEPFSSDDYVTQVRDVEILPNRDVEFPTDVTHGYYGKKRNQRNKKKAVICGIPLETCQEKINREKDLALSSHHAKCEEIAQKMMAFQKETTKKKKTKYYSLEEFEKLEALKQTAKELNGQTKEFVDLTNELLQELKSLKDVCDREISEEINSVEQRFAREKDRLSNGLPIYAEKSRIIRTIKENQVCIILGETGSGKSTQIVQYLYDAGFADTQTIVCTQPRKVAAFSLGRRVSEELKNPKLVDCIEPSKYRKSSILFTTDHALLMKCLRDRELSRYSCVVIDEAHERNINTDLLLGIIKKALPKRPDLRVVVTSATIDPTLFQEYFGTCPVIKVSGKLFPVDVEWKKSCQEHSFYTGNYVAEAVDKVVEIYRSNEAGDVLVFLTCPAEIEQACKALSSKINTSNIIVLPLHGKLQQEDQQKVFDPTPPGKRKVVFSTNCAETSLTIPGIKFVIDSGRVKEMKYDQKRNMSSLEISIVSQSSANQRKGRAGRTDSGKCFRLYTEEEYNAMEKSTKPEILRVHLGQALLKLMELGIDNPADFDYVESPPLESIKAAMAELEELEATREGKLTDLGKKMARVPLDPRLGKFLFEGFNQEIGYEALVLVSISTITGSVFFRMGSEEEKKKADDKKVEFCQLGGDLMTLLDVFRKWMEVNEQERGKWCYEKSLNAKSMRMAYETVKDLKMVLKRELKIDDIRWSPFDPDTTDGIIQKTLFTCFLTNLCVFTGHEKVGYQTVKGGHYVKVHPSSAVKVMGEYPKFVVYEKVLKTTQDFILNVTPIEDAWIMETITEPNLLGIIHQLLDETLVKRTIKCSQSLIRETMFPPKDKIPEVSQACDDKPVIVEMNMKEGCVDVFVSKTFATKGEESLQSLFEEVRKRLREQTDEFFVEDARSLQVVIESGLTVQHILMPGMYRTVFCPHYDQELIEFLKSQGDVIDISSNKKQQLFVTYKSPEEAKRAVNLANDFQLDVQPKSNSNQQQSRGSFNFVLDVSWLRRKSKGTARVVYDSNPVPWSDLTPRWSLNATVRSKTVRVTADKFHMDAVFLRGLDPSSTKREIKEALLDVFSGENVKDSNILNFYEQRETYQAVSIQDQKNKLDTLIEENIGSRNFEVFVKPPKNDKTVNSYAQVRFSSPNEGMMATKRLQNANCPGLERWTVQLQVRPKLDFYYTSLKSVYDLVKPEVDRRIDEIAEDCRFKCGKVLGLKVALLEKSANSNRVKLSVETECVDHYVEAATVLSTAIQGDFFDCTTPQERLPLLSPTFKDKITTIQKTTGTFICPDSRTKALVIYGKQAQKINAWKALENSVSDMESDDSVVWDVNLKGPNKPRGLLKQMMTTFGCDFETLCDVEGVVKINKNLFKHVLTIQSTKEAKEEVVRRLEEVERTLAQQQPRPEANQDNTNEECPICLCEVDEDEQAYRLATCGHAHCKECITAQLKSDANFPLTCAAESCGEKIVVKDLQNLLHAGKDLNDFVKMSLRSYINTNDEKAKYCPSPDCPMVYIVTDDARLFQCDVCSAATCSSCHKPYHLDMTCKEYENDLKDPGAQAFREWMEKDPNTRKRCPKCTSPIEKNEGCNHMQCRKCQAHFCWMCLEVFSSSGRVYDHQSSCPRRPTS